MKLAKNRPSGGNHRDVRRLQVRIAKAVKESYRTEANTYPEWKEVDPVAGDCPAGSAVWHNGLTAHGAGANIAIHYRGSAEAANELAEELNAARPGSAITVRADLLRELRRSER